MKNFQKIKQPNTIFNAFGVDTTKDHTICGITIKGEPKWKPYKKSNKALKTTTETDWIQNQLEQEMM